MMLLNTMPPDVLHDISTRLNLRTLKSMRSTSSVLRDSLNLRNRAVREITHGARTMAARGKARGKVFTDAVTHVFPMATMGGIQLPLYMVNRMVVVGHVRDYATRRATVIVTILRPPGVDDQIRRVEVTTSGDLLYKPITPATMASIGGSYALTATSRVKLVDRALVYMYLKKTMNQNSVNGGPLAPG
jgi:hypothetical protein